MIDKTEAQTGGYRVIETSVQLDEERTRKIAELKRVIPSFVNSDGAVDVNAIADFVGSDNTTSNNKGYELTFAGKGLARHLADIKTEKELKVEPKQSKNFDDTENVIIRGDNLDVLKILRQSYYGKIKMIYIDPPYNTQSDDFVYADNFKQSAEGLIKRLNWDDKTHKYIRNMYSTQTHSGWLAFMYPRLKLAQELLTKDGVIFISIDDKEQANLKIICDEIFGEANFISNIVVITGANQSGKGIKIQTNTEKCLVYCRDKSKVLINRIDKVQDSLRILNDAPSPLTKNATTGYTIYYNPKTEDIVPLQDYDSSKIDSNDEKEIYTDNKNLLSKGYVPIRPGKRKSKVWRWRWSFEEFVKRKNEVVVKENKGKFSAWFKQVGFNAPKNVLNFGVGTTELRDLLQKNDVFLYPKNSNYIKHLLLLGSNSNDIILDFFAGSGTTAHAVMELNKEDVGKRKFILVQWDEEIKQENKAAYDFCKENNLAPVISSICIERVHRAGEKIKQESDMLNQGLDIGYKVFSLTNKPQLEENENQLQLSHQRQTTQDTLYNMIVASGQDILTDPIEAIEPDLLYKVNDAYYVLGECKTDLKTVGKVFIDGYADISLERWLNMLGLNKENVIILY